MDARITRTPSASKAKANGSSGTAQRGFFDDAAGAAAAAAGAGRSSRSPHSSHSRRSSRSSRSSRHRRRGSRQQQQQRAGSNGAGGIGADGNGADAAYDVSEMKRRIDAQLGARRQSRASKALPVTPRREDEDNDDERQQDSDSSEARRRMFSNMGTSTRSFVNQDDMYGDRYSPVSSSGENASPSPRSPQQRPRSSRASSASSLAETWFDATSPYRKKKQLDRRTDVSPRVPDFPAPEIDHDNLPLADEHRVDVERHSVEAWSSDASSSSSSSSSYSSSSESGSNSTSSSSSDSRLHETLQQERRLRKAERKKLRAERKAAKSRERARRRAERDKHQLALQMHQHQQLTQQQQQQFIHQQQLARERAKRRRSKRKERRKQRRQRKKLEYMQKLMQHQRQQSTSELAKPQPPPLPRDPSMSAFDAVIGMQTTPEPSDPPEHSRQPSNALSVPSPGVSEGRIDGVGYKYGDITPSEASFGGHARRASGMSGMSVKHEANIRKLRSRIRSMEALSYDQALDRFEQLREEIEAGNELLDQERDPNYSTHDMWYTAGLVAKLRAKEFELTVLRFNIEHQRNVPNAVVYYYTFEPDVDETDKLRLEALLRMLAEHNDLINWMNETGAEVHEAPHFERSYRSQRQASLDTSGDIAPLSPASVPPSPAWISPRQPAQAPPQPVQQDQQQQTDAATGKVVAATTPNSLVPLPIGMHFLPQFGFGMTGDELSSSSSEDDLDDAPLPMMPPPPPPPVGLLASPSASPSSSSSSSSSDGEALDRLNAVLRAEKKKERKEKKQKKREAKKARRREAKRAEEEEQQQEMQEQHVFDMSDEGVAYNPSVLDMRDDIMRDAIVKARYMASDEANKESEIAALRLRLENYCNEIAAEATAREDRQRLVEDLEASVDSKMDKIDHCDAELGLIAPEDVSSDSSPSSASSSSPHRPRRRRRRRKPRLHVDVFPEHDELSSAPSEFADVTERALVPAGWEAPGPLEFASDPKPSLRAVSHAQELFVSIILVAVVFVFIQWVYGVTSAVVFCTPSTVQDFGIVEVLQEHVNCPPPEARTWLT